MSALKYAIRVKNEGLTKIINVEVNATFDEVTKKIQEAFKGKTVTPFVCASTKSAISNEEEFKAALEASTSERFFVIEAGSQVAPSTAKKDEPFKSKSTPKKEEPAKPAATTKPATPSKPAVSASAAPKKEEPAKPAAPAAAAAAAPAGNHCVKCSAKLPAGAKFCNNCGAPQNAAPAAAAAPAGNHCVKCSAKLPAGTKFCNKCGAPQNAAPAAAAPKKEEPKKEEGKKAAGPDCCAGCGKPLVGAAISLGDGKNYHPECFVCCECGKGIRGQYMMVDGKFVCGSCFEEKHRETCAACGKPVDGQYVGVGDKNYHPECFKCSKCNKQITGRFRYGRDGSLLCPSCN